MREKIQITLKENTRLNEILLDAIPHPTMLIHKNRIVLVANRIAREVGAKPGSYCWREFGHSEYISEGDKRRLEKYKEVPPAGIRCAFCLADEAITESKPTVCPEIEAFGKIWEVHWIPLEKDIYLHYAIDITEHKRTEEALKYSEERYKLAQRAANIGSWDWNIQTGDLEWSETIEPMFGFGPGKFGATFEAFLECVHPKDRQDIIDSVNACVDKGNDYDIEHRIIWPDGSVRWVLETGDVIRDKDNKAIRMLGIVQDITRRKHAEEILKRDKETLEKLVGERTEELLAAQKELDRAKRLSDIGTLAATVAHELRNPLGVIRIAAYNTRRKRQNPDIDRHLDNIEKKIAESEQIINNLLFYSRISMPQYENVRIYDILDECLVFARDMFPKLKVSIGKRYDRTKGDSIQADPLQMGELFTNILNNAYESFSEKRGKIKVRTEHEEEGFFKIVFEDNGPGMDEEGIEKAFKPFFSQKTMGTGLGLTVCYQIVNLHGGKIEIKSQKSEGTTVIVSLPIAKVL